MAISPVLGTALVSAVVSTVVLFVFHAFPLNSKIIEKHLAERDTVLWWGIASLYYFVILLIVGIPMQWVAKHWLCTK
jgi:hypothetical protein